jgi:hypothetical protein
MTSLWAWLLLTAVWIVAVGALLAVGDVRAGRRR